MKLGAPGAPEEASGSNQWIMHQMKKALMIGDLWLVEWLVWRRVTKEIKKVVEEGVLVAHETAVFLATSFFSSFQNNCSINLSFTCCLAV